jgi:hypothetical protein
VVPLAEPSADAVLRIETNAIASTGSRHIEDSFTASSNINLPQSEVFEADVEHLPILKRFSDELRKYLIGPPESEPGSQYERIRANNREYKLRLRRSVIDLLNANRE